MDKSLIIPELNQLVRFAKPELVVLSESPKLRELSIEEKNTKSFEVVKYLLNLLGVADGKTEHHKALIMHISQNYTDNTFEEIYKAFNLFAMGELQEKPLQQLNAVVFGKVMAEYSKLKRNQVKTYQLRLQEFKREAQPMSQDDIDEFMDEIISEAVEKFKKTGVIEMAANKYDWLDSKGRIQGERTKETWYKYKRTKYISCKASLKVELKNQKPVNKQEKINLTNTLKELEEAKSGKVVLRCKTEILEDYFKQLINNLKN